MANDRLWIICRACKSATVMAKYIPSTPDISDAEIDRLREFYDVHIRCGTRGSDLGGDRCFDLLAESTDGFEYGEAPTGERGIFVGGDFVAEVQTKTADPLGCNCGFDWTLEALMQHEHCPRCGHLQPLPQLQKTVSPEEMRRRGWELPPATSPNVVGYGVRNEGGVVTAVEVVDELAPCPECGGGGHTRILGQLGVHACPSCGGSGRRP